MRNSLGKCHNRIMSTGNSASKYLEARPLLGRLLRICFAFWIELGSVVYGSVTEKSIYAAVSNANSCDGCRGRIIGEILRDTSCDLD